MSVNLCIDWGNTQVKAAIFDNDKLQKQFTFSGDAALEKVTSIMDLYQPVKAILCSVVHNSDELGQLGESKIRSFIELEWVYAHTDK